MAEIKGLNTDMEMAESLYRPSAMEQALKKKQTRSWTRQVQGLIKKYFVFMVALVVLVTILLQSIAIYAMQRNMSNINNEIQLLQRSNETLRATVLQANNLDKARSVALDQNYVARTGLGGVKADLEYNNFTGKTLAKSSEGTKAEGTLIDRLLAVFE